MVTNHILETHQVKFPKIWDPQYRPQYVLMLVMGTPCMACPSCLKLLENTRFQCFGALNMLKQALISSHFLGLERYFSFFSSPDTCPLISVVSSELECSFLRWISYSLTVHLVLSQGSLNTSAAYNHI